MDTELSRQRASLIEWGAAGRALDGAPRSGDLQIVEPFPGGVLTGVIDGLGHGDLAADAADTAADVLSRHAGEPVGSLFLRCHEALVRTRGVAMSLASFDEGERRISWLGVGNVDAMLIRTARGAHPARESLLLRAGVVGFRLPRLFPSLLPVAAGDMLIFCSDGIGPGALDAVRLSGAPTTIAEDIVARFGKRTDDALSLVVRFRGAHS
jgi:negative regulator of sigma-B (phosphoserine phosphatase)